jgi:hypothetical protein
MHPCSVAEQKRRWVWLVGTVGALAITLAGCTIETSYVPRTPHTLALGMKAREPVVYKDGVLHEISSMPSTLVVCSADAAANVSEAASHHAGYILNLTIATVFNVLGAFVPPFFVPGIYFLTRATGHERQINAHVVDAINHHNDEIGCVPR